MTQTEVLPYQREGAWFSMHGLHYASAHRYRREFLNAQASLSAENASFSANVDDIPQEHRDSFIVHETMSLHDLIEQAFVSSILYSCMAVEAFINNYGVRRLGDDYFRRNLERHGITEKYSLLMLACYGRLISHNAPERMDLRAMFDTRNQLVHPKAREFRIELLEKERQEPPLENQLSLHFANMEGLIDRFCVLDDQVIRDFEFRKPAEFE